MLKRTLLPLLVAFIVSFTPSGARAQDGSLVSTMGLDIGVESADGIRIVPAPDIHTGVYTQDLAPPQVFELIRPDNGPVSIGRLMTSCTCLSASMEKRNFGAGERAVLTVRNIKATPAEGATYAVFVQVTSPVQQTLQLDLFVKSGSAPGQAAPVPVPTAGAPEPFVIHDVPTDPPMPAPYVSPSVITTPLHEVRPRRGPQPPPFRYEDVTPYTPRKAPDGAPAPKPAPEPAPVPELIIPTADGITQFDAQ